MLIYCKHSGFHGFVNRGVHAMFLLGPRYPVALGVSLPILIGFRLAFATTYI